MKKKVTKKQTEFAKEFVKNGGNGTQAALKVYDAKTPAAANAIASKNLKKPAVQDALKAELKRQNITLERAIKPIADALDDEDLDIRLKGSDRALKLLLPKEKNNIDLNFNIDSANFGGQFVGGVIDE